MYPFDNPPNKINPSSTPLKNSGLCYECFLRHNPPLKKTLVVIIYRFTDSDNLFLQNKTKIGRRFPVYVIYEVGKTLFGVNIERFFCFNDTSSSVAQSVERAAVNRKVGGL